MGYRWSPGKSLLNEGKSSSEKDIQREIERQTISFVSAIEDQQPLKMVSVDCLELQKLKVGANKFLLDRHI